MPTKKKLEKYQNPGPVGWSQGISPNAATIKPATRSDEARETQKDINARQEKINKVAKSILDSKGIDDFTDEDIDILSQSTVPNVTKILRDYRINIANKAQENQAGIIPTAEEFKNNTAAIGDKLSLQRLPGVGQYIPDVLDATGGIGQMAAGLGRVPLNIKEGDYGQAALNLGLPLLTGALGGLGTTSRGQFLNNLVNPLAGVGNKGSIYKNDFGWLDEEMRFMSLPKTSNKVALGVLDDFKYRLNTAEGKKRLSYLDVDKGDRLQNIEILEDPNSYGYYKPSLNRIARNPSDPLTSITTRHEIEHGVQAATKNKNTTKIDDLMSGIELRRQGTPDKQWGKSNKNEPVDASDYKSLLFNKQNATDYFLTGSGGAEKSTFLAEVQQYMMDTGVIPKRGYTKITPEMVRDTFTDAIFDDEKGGRYLRLFNIMKASDNNYSLIAKGLNKMLSATPVVAAGLLQQNKEQDLQNFQQGGATTNTVSHRMAVETPDGENWFAFPMVDYDPATKKWIKFEDEWEAFEYHKKNNTLLPIPEKDLALYYGQEGIVKHGDIKSNPEYDAISNVLNQRNKHINWIKRGLNPENYPSLTEEDYNNLPIGAEEMKKKNKLEKYQNSGPVKDQSFIPSINNIFQQGLGIAPNITNPGGNPFGTSIFGDQLTKGIFDTGQLFKGMPQLNQLETPLGAWGGDVSKGIEKSILDEDMKKYKADNFFNSAKAWADESGQTFSEPSKMFGAYQKSIQDRAGQQYDNTIAAQKTWNEYGKPLAANMAAMNSLTDMQAVEGLKGNKNALYRVDDEVKGMENKGIFQMGGAPQISALQQALGYKDSSPFKKLPSQTILRNMSADGVNITMDGVSKNLYLIPDKGRPVLAQGNSGEYYFPNANAVEEIPAMQDGGASMLADTISNNKRTIGNLNRNTSTLKAHKDINLTPQGVAKRMVEDLLRIEDLKRQEEKGVTNEASQLVTKRGLNIDEKELQTKLIDLYNRQNYNEALELAGITEGDISIYTDNLLAVSDLMNEYGVKELKRPQQNRLRRIIGNNSGFFDPSTDTVYARDLNQIVEEVAHAKQKKDGMNLVSTHINDWIKDPYITRQGYRRQYKTPGTMEHEAHSVIAPKLHEEVIDKRKRFAGIFQQGGSVTPSLRKRIYDIVSHEKKQGSIEGKELLNAGIKPEDAKKWLEKKYGVGSKQSLNYISDDDAVDYIIENYLPKVKGLNTEDEIIAALDMQYNGGKDARIFAYQEWLRSQDPKNTTGWMDKNRKWKDRNNPPPDFDKLYNESLGKLKDEERLDWIDKGRDWYYRNIFDPALSVGVGYWGRTKNPDKNKKIDEDYYLHTDGYYYERGADGTLSPGYGKTWSGRLAYTKPKKAATKSATSQPQQPTSQPQIQQTTTSPQTQPARTQQSISTQPTNINQQRQNIDPSKIRHINQLKQFLPQYPQGIRMTNEVLGEEDPVVWTRSGNDIYRTNKKTGVTEDINMAPIDWTSERQIGSVPQQSSMLPQKSGRKKLTTGPTGRPIKYDTWDFYDEGDGTYTRVRPTGEESSTFDYETYLKHMIEEGGLTWQEEEQLLKNRPKKKEEGGPTNLQTPTEPTYNYLSDFEKLEYVKKLKGYVEKYGFESLVESDPKGAMFLQEQLELLSKGGTDPKDPPVVGGNPAEGEDIVITAKRDKEKSNAYIPSLSSVVDRLKNPAQLEANDNLFKELIEGFKEQKSAAQREQEYKRKLQLMFAEQYKQKMQEQVGSNISTGRGRFQQGGIPILNLSKNINYKRLNPHGIYKMGGLITEGSEYNKRKQPKKNSITGASSTGPMGPKDMPSYDGGIRAIIDQEKNEIIPTENLIPIQAEKGELIVLPTGDVVPVMAKKRHHQMDEDEVTDVAPEGAYILSSFGRVKIKKKEAENVIAETGVKPYKLGIGQETPTEKTLGDIMTKKEMAPAEVGKLISRRFPVIATDNPYEAAANTENKINRRPYLEGLIQLSEFDKMRKGIDTSTPEATREYRDEEEEEMYEYEGGGSEMEGAEVEEMMQGGNPMFRRNISHAQDPLTAAAIQAGSGLLQSITSIIGSAQQRKAADKAYRDVLRMSNQSADRQRGQLGLGAAAGILGTLSQDPTVNAAYLNPTYINQMQTRTPSQITDSIANSAFANMPTYSNLAPQQQMLASQAAWGQALKAAGDARMNAWAGDRAAKNQQLQSLQQYYDTNENNRVAAQNATRLNRNQQIGNVGDRTQGYFDSTATIEANLGQTQANARLGQGAAQQQAIRSYTQGINQAIGTAGAAAYDLYANKKATPTVPNLNVNNPAAAPTNIPSGVVMTQTCGACLNRSKVCLGSDGYNYTVSC